MTHAPISAADHETLKSELAICCRQLQSKEQALKILKQELDLSHQRLEHSQQEVAQLRSQLARSSNVPRDDLVQEKEQFIKQLEEAQEKIAELERQLQMEEDEKEEVLGERDYFSSQCSALVKCLEEKKSTQAPSQSALQTLADENRQLKLQLVEVQAERDQAQARVDRYKRVVERRKAKDAQDVQSVGPGRQNNLRQALRHVSELEVLANSLSESVKEKSIALTHQKKANKILGARIADLEHRLKVLEISGLWSASTGLVPELTWNEDPKVGVDAESRKDGASLLSPERTAAPGPSYFPSSSPHSSPPPEQPTSHLHTSDPTSSSLAQFSLSHSPPFTGTATHTSPLHPSHTNPSPPHIPPSHPPPVSKEPAVNTEDTEEREEKEKEEEGKRREEQEKANSIVFV